MTQPLISVIVPVFNHAAELGRALESVYSQTVKDLEVVVINDGSQDNLTPILSKWQGQHSDLKIINQTNQGAAAARNRGFKESAGRYVIFWDADLVAKPEMLEKMSRALAEHPEVSFVYSSFHFGWKKFTGRTFDSVALRQANYIHTSALLRRKRFPGFDENLKKFQDWDLWLTMAENGHSGLWLDEYLFAIKPRSKGISSWLPSFLYHFPWLPIPALKKYVYWRDIIRKKHHLQLA